MAYHSLYTGFIRTGARRHFFSPFFLCFFVLFLFSFKRVPKGGEAIRSLFSSLLKGRENDLFTQPRKLTEGLSKREDDEESSTVSQARRRRRRQMRWSRKVFRLRAPRQKRS